MEIMVALILFIGFINLVLLFMICLNSVTIKLVVTQLQAATAVALNKLNTLEGMNIKLGASFNEFINMTSDMVDRIDDMMKFPTGVPMFRTMDGKFTARSMDELIDKIKKANKEGDYLSEEELNKLKDLFNNESDDSDDDDDEEN